MKTFEYWVLLIKYIFSDKYNMKYWDTLTVFHFIQEKLSLHKNTNGSKDSTFLFQFLWLFLGPFSAGQDLTSAAENCTSLMKGVGCLKSQNSGQKAPWDVFYRPEPPNEAYTVEQRLGSCEISPHPTFSYVWLLPVTWCLVMVLWAHLSIFHAWSIDLPFTLWEITS